jgi:secreted trypsin-like serine protease
MVKEGTRAALAASLIAFVCLTGCAWDEPDEPNEEAESSIIGGKIEEGYDAVVHVSFDDPDRKETFTCTGTLVSPRSVLTAAHCVVPQGLSKRYANYRVYFGDDAARARRRDVVSVTRAVAHPQYVPLAFGRGKDAAMLTLAQPVRIAPIPLDRITGTSTLVGSSSRAVGFGFDGGQSDRARGLGIKRSVQMKIRQQTPVEISAYSEGRTICQGDSGGPLLAKRDGKELVFGITSYSNNLECDGAGGFTRVDDVLDFIDANIAR